MDRRLVIFAGAGASAAVDAEQYPATLGFRKRLPSHLAAHHLFVHAESYLEHHKKLPTPFDIEQILWVLKELLEAFQGITQVDSFSYFLHNSGQLGGIGIESPQNKLSQYQNATNIIQTLIQDINVVVYDLYGAIPEEQQLRQTWIPMLTWAARNFSVVDVVTTNYDVVIEEALGFIPNSTVRTGHVSRHGTTIDLNRWKAVDSDGGLLTKLHGSVNWRYGRGVAGSADPIIRVVGPEFDGNHDLRAIIYPGYKDAPSREPFQLFHTYFGERLRRASHVVSLGFAFRDEYINALINQLPLSGHSALIVDPAPREAARYPKFGSMKFLKKGFDFASSSASTLESELDAWLTKSE